MKVRHLILLLATFLVATAQERPEPPAGWACTPRGMVKDGQQTNDHPCSCKRMDHSDDCEGVPLEDPVCEVYCHKEHCQCPVMCAMPETEHNS